MCVCVLQHCAQADGVLSPVCRMPFTRSHCTQASFDIPNNNFVRIWIFIFHALTAHSAHNAATADRYTYSICFIFQAFLFAVSVFLFFFTLSSSSLSFLSPKSSWKERKKEIIVAGVVYLIEVHNHYQRQYNNFIRFCLSSLWVAWSSLVWRAQNFHYYSQEADFTSEAH